MYIIIIMVIIFFMAIADMCVLNVKGAGSLVTTPPAVDGVLTSCGETQLTCSHDNVVGENTRWRIGTTMDSSSVCQVTVDHTSPATPYSCNVFSFGDVTALPAGGGNNASMFPFLNSTAMVSRLPPDLSGSQMQCVEGTLSTSPLVGSVTLCVIGEHTCS